MGDIPQIPSNPGQGTLTSGDNQAGIQAFSQPMEIHHSFQHNMGQTSHEASPYGMASLAQALPQYQSQGYTYGPQAFPHQFANPGRADQAIPYQSLQSSHFAGQGAATNPSFNPQYIQQYPNQMPPSQFFRPAGQNFMATQGARTLPTAPTSYMDPNLISQQQTQPQHQAHWQQGYSPNFPQSSPGFQSGPGRGHPYALNPAQNLPYGLVPPQPLNVTPVENFPGHSPLRLAGSRPGHTESLSRKSSDSNVSPSIPRGPPRKPKQSGHALWVGNLPPGATVYDLKDHFSRDATDDIESVFLISKSNCAFVNYRSENTCAAAMARFHDSRFQGVRLVCRLRRGTGATPAGTPVGPSATQASLPPEEPKDISPETKSPEQGETVSAQSPQKVREKVLEKYFVVKSLTIEDLELSVRNGIWATQAHNEATLNKAFESAENVYLIFSANKSGEYFGYARMISAIDEEAAASIALPTKIGPETAFESDLPITTPTPATEFAPKGRVIDDSARGTIFWEADLVESPSAEEPVAEIPAESPSPTKEAGEQESFGKPFKIQWLSTERLPFYRTRGLRNPWNANREVKIARDGTELEPGVGRRLVGMFHRPQVPGPSPTGRGVGVGHLQRNYS